MSDWERKISRENGLEYFHNIMTGQSTWQIPDTLTRNKYEIELEKWLTDGMKYNKCDQEEFLKKREKKAFKKFLFNIFENKRIYTDLVKKIETTRRIFTQSLEPEKRDLSCLEYCLESEIQKVKQEICSILVETYNTTILDKIPIEPKICVGSDRQVLNQLIDNHYNIDKIKPNYQYIGGPKTLTCHWNSFYKKVIYIFGEDHFDYTDCVQNPPLAIKQILIEDYLKKLIINTDVFLDIYVELPVYKGSGYKYPYSDYITHLEQRIMKIGKILHTCVDKESRNANRECDLSRIHYFDVRKSQTKEGLNDVSAFSYEVSKVYNSMPRGYSRKHINTLSKITDSFMETLKNFCLEPVTVEETKKFNEFWTGQISSNLIAIKEFNKSFGVTGLVDFFKKELLVVANKNNKKIKELVTYIIEYRSKHPNQKSDEDENFIYCYESLIPLITENNYMVADVYTLSRIFKQFNLDPDDSTKKRPTDEPIEPHNIIIYAGDFHSNNYRKFLNEVLGFKEIARVGKSQVDEGKPKACLDMTGFPQPFFSSWPPPSMPGTWISDYTNTTSNVNTLSG